MKVLENIIFPHKKGWYSAAEQQSPVLLTDLDFQTSCLLALPFPARWSKGGDANVQLIYLPSCVFLWTPQQRLHVQPDLFCCTQNLPQFPLWMTDGPAGHSWLSLDDAVLFRGKKIPGQAIDWVLMMLLLLALRNYFMTGCSGVRYCINKRCSQDMMHSHALQAGWDVCNITHNGRV